jgi:hypothetical protein
VSSEEKREPQEIVPKLLNCEMRGAEIDFTITLTRPGYP